MQISFNTNPIAPQATAASIVAGSGRGVESSIAAAETVDSVVFAPVEAVSISDAARRASQQPSVEAVADTVAAGSVAADNEPASARSGEVGAEQPSEQENRDAGSGEVTSRATEQQSRAEQRQQDADLAQIRQLKARDAEVKAHEAAHAAVGGQLAGSPSYSYQRGPDGVRYAVGGEVPIDVSKVAGDPQATLEKMQRVQRAALAPAEPSVQDRRVAALAAQQAVEARAEISLQSRVADGESEDEAAESRPQSDERVDRQAQAEKQAEEKRQEAERESVKASEVFAEQNARLRRINEFLLEISAPRSVNAGDLIDDVV